MRILLSLGSNLGDREGNLRAALRALRTLPGVTLGRVSHCYETKPLVDTAQPDFLNLAAEIETDLDPLELLDAVKDIEERVGRVATRRWGPRVIDIDLILCGAKAISEERLTVPHPEFRKRAFVLAPLAEIAPDAIDPVTGQTVAELATRGAAEGEVVRSRYITP